MIEKGQQELDIVDTAQNTLENLEIDCMPEIDFYFPLPFEKRLQQKKKQICQ